MQNKNRHHFANLVALFLAPAFYLLNGNYFGTSNVPCSPVYWLWLLMASVAILGFIFGLSYVTKHFKKSAKHLQVAYSLIIFLNIVAITSIVITPAMACMYD